MRKICVVCGNEFDARNSRYLCCSRECSAERQGQLLVKKILEKAKPNPKYMHAYYLKTRNKRRWKNYNAKGHVLSIEGDFILVSGVASTPVSHVVELLQSAGYKVIPPVE